MRAVEGSLGRSPRESSENRKGFVGLMARREKSIVK